MNKKRILFCPLNWGLGHATRMVPLINTQLNIGNEVVIAADGKALAFLQQEFPDLTFDVFKGINIRYFKKPYFLVGLLLQMPLFGLQIIYEYYRTKQLVKTYEPNTIISDNRYGARSSNCKSILVTHQLFIQLPKTIKWAEPILHGFTRYLINQFNTCCIPDYEKNEESLSGNLSHGKPIPANVRYIGPLSRFDFTSNIKNTPTPNIDVLVIVSGPEPYRTAYERTIEEQFKGTNKTVLIIQGKPQHKHDKNNYLPDMNAGGVFRVPHLSSKLLHHYILNAKEIHARIGYSSLMDLHPLKAKIIWSPTPGQTEQEYLYRWINR